jgi:hypothetical protein
MALPPKGGEEVSKSIEGNDADIKGGGDSVEELLFGIYLSENYLKWIY